MKNLLALILLTQLTHAYTPDEQATLKALPIIASKCAACHGEDPDDIDGELNLLSRQGFLAGGEFIKDLLIPGSPEKSFLLTVVKWEDPDYEMPPKENDRRRNHHRNLRRPLRRLDQPPLPTRHHLGLPTPHQTNPTLPTR